MFHVYNIKKRKKIDKGDSRCLNYQARIYSIYNEEC